MTFAAFLKKYYLPQQQVEIAFILRKHCMYNDVEFYLDEFYRAIKRSNKMEIIAQLVFTISELVATIYRQLQQTDHDNCRLPEESKITTLASHVVKDCYLLSQLKLSEYYHLLVHTVKSTYTKHRWNFAVIEKQLSFDKFKELIIAQETNNISKPVKFTWQGVKQLDLFVHDLAKTFRGFKARKQIYFLFDTIKTDFKIELSSNHLLPFLTLFYKLHESGVIKVCGNRGLFVYLRRHLQPPQQDMYPKRDFRKLKHEAEQNEKIKNKNFSIIKPLLDKYCTNR